MSEDTTEQSFEPEAKELGWVPEGEFRGDPSRWVDAKTFVERGSTMMPLLRKNNERLRGELRQAHEKLSTLEATVAASQESIQELMKFHDADVKRKVENTRRAIVEEIKAARAAGDVDAEAAALDDLSQLHADVKAQSVKAEERKPAPAETPKDYSKEPFLIDWMERNPWYGKDVRKTRMANLISIELRAADPEKKLTNEAFMQAVSEELEKTFGEDRRLQDERVEGGGRNGSGRGNGSDNGNGQGYRDLPRDAREVCDQQAGKMVGDGRAFKTLGDWQKYYSTTYFAS